MRAKEEFEQVLAYRLAPMIEYLKLFWNERMSIGEEGTGVHDCIPINGVEPPDGLKYKFYNIPSLSIIKDVPLYTFIAINKLNLKGVGSINKLFKEYMKDDSMTLDGFSVLYRSYNPDTRGKSGILCLVPTYTLYHTGQCGRWLYLESSELEDLRRGVVSPEVQYKARKICYEDLLK